MCVSTMANDGGLRKVIQSADVVYDRLVRLDQSAAAADDKRKPSSSEVSSSSTFNKLNLSQHSSAALKQAIAPLIDSMEHLDAAALLSLHAKKNSNGAILDPQKGLSVPAIHDRIVPHHRNHRKENIVRYLHAKEVADKYTVGLFVFPAGASIPLHDHPSMVVISRVLYGELNVKSYSIVSSVHKNDTEKIEEETSSTEYESSPSRLRSSFYRIKDFVSRTVLSSSYDNYDETQQKLQVTENTSPLGVQFTSDGDGKKSACIKAPNVTALYPDEGNCHSFVAGPNGAAVLDVLIPPYDEDDHRDCTFYEAIENEHGYCLIPIEQPNDFECLSGSYGRFRDDY